MKDENEIIACEDAEGLLRRDINDVLRGIEPQTDKINLTGIVHLDGERFGWRLQLMKLEEGYIMPDSGQIIKELGDFENV